MSYQIIEGDIKIKELQSQLGQATWPVFMQQDEVANHFWSSLYEQFLDFQFAAFDEGELIGLGNAIPLFWEKPLGQLPDEGFDWAMQQACADHIAGKAANTLCALQILINPEFRGKGISYALLDIMKGIAIKKGLKQLILPVRPNLKWKHPTIPMDEYVTWGNEDGLPFDPWFRVHIRAGARMLHPCNQSMVMKGTVSDWEEWTGKSFPESGYFAVDEALMPVSINKKEDFGVYVEPNVWFVYDLQDA